METIEAISERIAAGNARDRVKFAAVSGRLAVAASQSNVAAMADIVKELTELEEPDGDISGEAADG